MRRILIIGATSALAHEAAKLFAKDGATLFLVGRNRSKLEVVESDLKVRGATQVHAFQLDLNQLDRHQAIFDTALDAMGGLDAILVAHGTLGDQQASQDSVNIALSELSTNFMSVVSILTIAANYFEKQKNGCIAVIGSVAGDRGRQSNYVYGTAKGGLDVFLQGLRNRMAKSNVAVVTIKPGLIDTPMTAGMKKGLLMAKAEVVGRDIHAAMLKGQSTLYTPWFWRYIMTIIRYIPEPIFKRLKL